MMQTQPGKIALWLMAGLAAVSGALANDWMIWVAAALSWGLAAFVTMNINAACRHAEATARKLQAQLDEVSANNGDEVRSLEKLICEILPIWERNVELARGQTEESTNALTKRFSTILDRQKTGHSGSAEEVVNALSNGESELGAIVTSLQEAVTARAKFQGEIVELARFTEELKSMASDVATIAGQTNLLALNAAIEAARAGEHGRGFAVVADEVRKLSTLSGDTGKRISEKIENANQAMSALVTIARTSAESDSAIIGDANNTIQTVIGQFSAAITHLRDELSKESEHAAAVEQEVQHVLVDLQYQDRMSQILTHVVSDMNKLGKSVKQGELKTINVENWLQTLSKSYTTLEQHAAHHGKQATVASSEITFF